MWKRTSARSVALGLACAAIAAGPACSSDREAGAPSLTRIPEPGDASDAIGRDLMLALAQAKNFHHKAKVYMSDGNLAAAIGSVRQVLALQFPAGAPEADDVRNDARALLAKLLMSQGQLDDAARVVDDGLAHAARDSFFVANLYTVQGELHEARAAALDAAPPASGDPGDPGATGKAAAATERRAAIESYDRSIQINQRLLNQLTEQR
jgi:tetratricopeptide (TPR) repeat protein